MSRAAVRLVAVCLAALAVMITCAGDREQATDPTRSLRSLADTPGTRDTITVAGVAPTGIQDRAAPAVVKRRRPAPAPAPAPTTRPTVAPAPMRAEPAPRAPHGAVPGLIWTYFPSWAESTALCVAWRESRYQPSAYNRSSGASGVFQWVPGSWAYFSARAGWSGASPFGARANIATAAWAVQHGGWGPWGGGC